MKVGIILHYPENALDFPAIAKQTDCEIFLRRGVLEYAIEGAQELEQDNHVDAILASAATAHVISPHLNVPVVPMYINSFNLIEACVRARKIGSSMAFIDITRDSIYNLEHISDMTGYDIKRYEFHSVDETQQVAEKIKADRREVIVTSAKCMYSCAMRNQINAVLIHVTEQDIISAIDTAKLLITIQNQTLEKYKWLSAAVENADAGLIMINKEGRITLANSIALKTLELPASELIGRPVAFFADRSPILKALTKTSEEPIVLQHNAKEYIISTKPVSSGDTYLGSVASIRILKELQEAELFARKKILERGFVAQNTLSDIIGESHALQDLRRRAQLYAKADSTILILGESGSGKELFAQGVHNASPRKNGPFVAVNCAALSETLLDSELFGYEGGAFTGAKRSGSAGLFEQAHGGTLFLDEIGELPVQLQSKILRTLQERSVRRIGGSKNIPIDVRIILATNRNLPEEVSKGNFREDLYYRINILTLIIPPLRSRREDIPLLISHFFSAHASGAAPCPQLTEEQIEKLSQYDWPGNVRELYSFLERLSAMQTPDIPLSHVFENLYHELTAANALHPHPAEAAADGDSLVVPIGSLRDIENSIIQQLLAQHDGDKKAVEQILGISATTLWRRLKENA